MCGEGEVLHGVVWAGELTDGTKLNLKLNLNKGAEARGAVCTTETGNREV